MDSLPVVLVPTQAAAVVIRFLVLAVTEAMLDCPELRQPLAMAAAEVAGQTVSLAVLVLVDVSRFWTLEHNMERYAQLSGNTIATVIESELDPDGINGEWVACGDAGPGWTYDGTVFTPPQVNRKSVILARLVEIDTTSDKPRTRRELALSTDATKVWLQALDDEAAALRTELAGL